MNMRRIPRRKLVRDLTRVRHMTAVSAVVLGTTFMPLLGLPEPYELRAFQGAVESFSDARARVLTPQRDDEAARERSARVIGERHERQNRRASREAEAETMPAVASPDEPPIELVDTMEVAPLSPMEEDPLAAPFEQEVVEPVEEKPVAPESEEPASADLPILSPDDDG